MDWTQIALILVSVFATFLLVLLFVAADDCVNKEKKIKDLEETVETYRKASIECDRLTHGLKGIRQTAAVLKDQLDKLAQSK